MFYQIIKNTSYGWPYFINEKFQVQINGWAGITQFYMMACGQRSLLTLRPVFLTDPASQSGLVMQTSRSSSIQWDMLEKHLSK